MVCFGEFVVVCDVLVSANAAIGHGGDTWCGRVGVWCFVL